ncbi:unnamed protein product [Fusarium graminearum]|uniref:Chromosome 2, complete genome n=1 Tax=Gibberella zeae (strain ATCC MYA-4620 / CBS 123657 / FGSC 9075 / NRRL 31084 / PH-1) TaxID=229533 RepID=A0A1C3YN05_GIBZE|nr:unnamed protein product [Fusarium graminearum]
MSSLSSCSSSNTTDVAQDMIASDVDSLITQDDIPVETQAKDQPKVQFLVALNIVGSDRSPPWTSISRRAMKLGKDVTKVGLISWFRVGIEEPPTRKPFTSKSQVSLLMFLMQLWTAFVLPVYRVLPERIVLNLIKAGFLDVDHVKEVYAGIDEYCSDYEILPPEP